ncbi:hypothetical protein RIF29_13804 [Crotalaria pallida]|uniref:Zinc finger CCCH domain-containing protein 5 n=1 Tax=Crotalaria pallida TaxID=3830 RepID=A0AAN9IQ73_CROPI
MEEGGGGMEKKSMRGRKEKRKENKKKKRKEGRKEKAVKEREEEEAAMKDEEYRKRVEQMEREEALRMERERMEFEERERAFQQQLLLDKQKNLKKLLEQSEEEEEEGLPEIIWKGNEIIFNKKKEQKMIPYNQLDNDNDNDNDNDDDNCSKRRARARARSAAALSSSNPLAVLVPPSSNFGTEKDKAHCPFHMKTGACRFGHRCSRLHFYPPTSSTLLISNMFTPPSSSSLLDDDYDNSLEYTDEEVESCYQEFYEDVHTEFLKFGEIVNFKVCKNGAFHLRGNVYVQYKSLDSALLAYNSVNGRYFAGKQITCNFVNLTRWKVAICGEYMKSGYKTCSHGTACNFIHCFRNPGGDYEWADLDKPPPMYWIKKMAALFGYSNDYVNLRERENFSAMKNSHKMSKTDSDRHHSQRSRSREVVQLNSGCSSRRKHDDERRQVTPDEEQNGNLNDNYKRKHGIPDTDSDREWLDKEGYREKHYKHARKSSFNRKNDDNSRSHEEDSDTGWAAITRDTEKQHGRQGKNSRKSYKDGSKDWIYEAGPYGHRDGKSHRHSKSKSSKHQNRDNGNVATESESDKDSFDRRDMETQPDYSRKSRRHRRDNEEVDEGWSRRESSRRAHNHKKKTSKHQKKSDSINADTKDDCQENSGELSAKNLCEDRHHKTK